MFDDANFIPEVGSRIGNYKVINIAGSPGGTAIAVICETNSGKKVVVKRFKPESLSDKMRERIHEEASLNLNSSYLVTSNEVFEDKGYLHSVMSYIRGRNLSDILCCGDGLAEDNVIHLGTRLAIAACDMHRHNLLFTDIKPENILINNTGQVKIIDLTCFERIGKIPEISLGTQPYAPPELAQRKKLSAAVDIYSIGIVLYEAIIGTNQFASQNYNLEISSITKRFPNTARIIAKAINPAPEKRYQTARDLLNNLENPISSRAKYEFSFTRRDGKTLIIPIGTFTLGRNEIAPQNNYISEKQFECTYSGTTAKIRDIANKNQAFLDGTLISKNWIKITNSSCLKIANIQLVFNLR